MQTDEHEQERVQEVLDDLPDGDSLQTHLRGRQLGRMPAEIDPRGHGREDGGDTQELG